MFIVVCVLKMTDGISQFRPQGVKCKNVRVEMAWGGGPENMSEKIGLAL
jgi:hypothetical protein